MTTVSPPPPGVLADPLGAAALDGPDTAAVPDRKRPGAAQLSLALTRRLVGVVLMLAGQGCILADASTAILRPLLGAVLLVGLPVVVLTYGTFGRLRNRLHALLFAFGSTTAGLLGVGLLLNTVLPWVGIDRPLARPVLVVASAVIDAALLLHRPSVPLLPLRAWATALVRARVEPAVALGLLSGVLAVAGAVRLNNGDSGTVATVAHAAAVAALLVAFARRRITEAGRAAAIASAALALLLGTSLRGWFITGHDVQNEYLSFLFTHNAQHWVMSDYPVPYHACLSVNILPSVLVDYLGITGVFAFKVVLQVLFAMVPVAVYALARGMVSARLAVLAATMFVLFPTFYTDMPFLVRQEVAYLFVALALLAARQRGFRTWARYGLTFVFGVAVVLSHYSTTYMLLVTLALGGAGLAAGSVLRRREAPRVATGRRPYGLRLRAERPDRLRAKPVLLHPVLIVALAVTAWAWSSPATHTGGHLTATVRDLLDGNVGAGSSDVGYNPLLGGGPTEAQRWSDYLAQVRADRAAPARDYVFPHLLPAVSSPRLVARDYLPLTTVGHRLQDLGLDVRGMNDLTRSGLAALLQLLLLIGLIALALRARSTRRVGRETFWLMAGSVGAVAFVAAVPGVSADYGVLRAFQQALLVVAPLLAVGLATCVQRLRRSATGAMVAVTAIIGLVLTGAAPAVVGGYYGQLSQSNAGQYYDLFYVDSPELSAAQWLGGTTAARPGLQYVTANGIVTITRLNMFTPRSVIVDGDLLPALLRKDHYVFLTPQTVLHGQATVFSDGDLLTYSYPVHRLDARLDLVYSTTGTRIYR